MGKKKFQAIKADTGDYKGIVHDGKKMRFRRDDTFIIEDEGLAREIDHVHGRKGTQKLSVVPYDDMETREPGHKYRFGPSPSYVRAWEAFEKRRKQKARKVKNAARQTP